MAATVVLDQQLRNGTFDTASLPVPPGATSVTLDTTMSNSDGLNTSNRAIVGVRFSWDGTAYQDNAAFAYEWSGGPDKHGVGRGPNLGGTMPSDAQGNPPVRVVAFIDTEGFSINTGVTLEFS